MNVTSSLRTEVKSEKGSNIKIKKHYFYIITHN